MYDKRNKDVMTYWSNCKHKTIEGATTITLINSTKNFGRSSVATSKHAC